MTFQFPFTISDAPCQILVTKVTVQPPLGPNCDSDWDCFGWYEVEFEVLDRKGYVAGWLAAKLTDQERETIELGAVKIAAEARRNDY